MILLLSHWIAICTTMMFRGILFGSNSLHESIYRVAALPATASHRIVNNKATITGTLMGRRTTRFFSTGSHISKATHRSDATRVLSRLIVAHSCFHSALFSTSSGSVSAAAAATGGSTATNIVHNGVAISEPPTPVEHFRLDYKKSEYAIHEIYLSFQLDDVSTEVTALSTVTKEHEASSADLELDGEELELLSVKIDGILLDPSQYRVNSDKLIIPHTTLVAALGVPVHRFQVETKVAIRPDKNLSLSGLYKSGQSSLLSTQCEAMGFRRIAYHLDRPDVLSRYRVRLEADKLRYPLLLSNGNCIEQGDATTASSSSSSSKRHYAVWDDPFPKPSYLFALVAGDLGSIHSTYTTTSGRIVQLGIYSDKENSEQLEHAMLSLKQSMQWDEDTFGLECDLDTYNVVATNDFNMGAMENKGLNIFNSAYVLADPKTATDDDFERILGVIGHEYFHNWSGNRVTVRDWFQLTLKEGLTVFRDQWFSSDLTSHAVKRIEDVRSLRSRQFSEDGGPMAHPIRPESYISMDNFYTSTVYSKGAEIVGIYKTLLGVEGFKRGLKLYFDRFDGKAVTCDDFRDAMADANGVDLSQMDRWYSQAGTPVVTVTQLFDSSTSRLTLTLSQHTPSTPGQLQDDKKPLLIPVVVGALDRTTGAELLPSTVLQLKEATQSFEFEGIRSEPVLSVLRDFSAPVKLSIAQSDDDLLLLMAFDTDSFNRWDASNRYFIRLVLTLSALPAADIDAFKLPEMFVDAIRTVLVSAKSSTVDPSLIAYALQLPDLTTLLTQQKLFDIDGLYRARKHIKRTLSTLLYAELEDIYTHTASADDYRFDPSEVGRRRLHNTCLDYLTVDGLHPSAVPRAKYQFDSSTCMTDKLAALSCLASIDCSERDDAIEKFYRDAGSNALVLNKWFMIQAIADNDNVLARVKELRSHPAFILSNPNRARSLISAFAGNLHHFHRIDGSGYRFLADSILDIDRLNPQVAARMVSSFAQWRTFDATRGEMMRTELRRIEVEKGLSPDTFEVVLRCLK